jgi:hypothetical protein
MQTPRRSYWVGLWLLTACLFIFPISNRPLRVATILLTLATYASLIYLSRRRRPILVALISLGFFIVGFLAIPGRNANAQQLRIAYLNSLRAYEGTRYIWGGEKKLGIDCSGLVRAGFIRANVEQGLLTLNPKPVRFGLSLWWHDCSAKALGEEYRGMTRQIMPSSGINLLDNSKIQPGDIAVTTSGVHVLAYLGGDEWIEADPDLKKVVIVKVSAKDIPWFYEPVRILRWTELETD